MALCCGPYLHDGAGAPAPDPLALMRSRYTAYALREEAYLLATWHASTRPACAASLPGTKWLGLEVRNHHLIDDSHAEVEFVARCRIGGKAVRQHERSRFVREAGRWFYVRGVLL